jgi:hypothetical protein
MTVPLILAAVLIVLGVVAGEAAARRYRGRLNDACRVRRQAPERVRMRW